MLQAFFNTLSQTLAKSNADAVNLCLSLTVGLHGRNCGAIFILLVTAAAVAIARHEATMHLYGKDNSWLYPVQISSYWT
jgi:hypothetical protein